MTTTLLLARHGPSSPFWEGAAIAAVALVVALTVAQRGPATEHPLSEDDRERTHEKPHAEQSLT